MEGAGEEAWKLLAENRLGRMGLHVKLDKGFSEGTYCVYVEFDGLAERVGFAAAHRLATDYCVMLKRQMQSVPALVLGDIEDASQSRDKRRRHDLEATFLWFPIESSECRLSDKAIKESFDVAFLRAGQAWDQVEAGKQTHRRTERQKRFRLELARLLDEPAFAVLDPGAKAKLLREVPSLAFPARGRG